MKPAFLLTLFLLASFIMYAQFTMNRTISGWNDGAPVLVPDFRPQYEGRKLYQRNHGIIIGLQKGASTLVEFGGEAHWRKMSLRKPRIWGATANMEYDFGNHIAGYKAGVWRKQGRINFTYGLNAVWFTDFKGQSRYGVNPAIGFRLAGFHLVNGYNITTGDSEMDDVNALYLSLRYYFPLQNKFVWDRKTRKKMEEKREEREKRREERKAGKRGLRKIFNFRKKDKEEEVEEKPKKKLFGFLQKKEE